MLNPQIIGQISSEGSTVSAALIGQHGQQSIINTQQSAGLLTTQHIPPLLNNSLMIGQDCNTYIRQTAAPPPVPPPPPPPLPPPPPQPNSVEPPALTPIHIPAQNDNHGLHTIDTSKEIMPKEEICDMSPRVMDGCTSDSITMTDKVELSLTNGCRSQVNYIQVFTYLKF